MKIDVVGAIGDAVITAVFAVMFVIAVRRRRWGQILPYGALVVVGCVLLFFVLRGYRFGGPVLRIYPPGTW